MPGKYTQFFGEGVTSLSDQHVSGGSSLRLLYPGFTVHFYTLNHCRILFLGGNLRLYQNSHSAMAKGDPSYL